MMKPSVIGLLVSGRCWTVRIFPRRPGAALAAGPQIYPHENVIEVEDDRPHEALARVRDALAASGEQQSTRRDRRGTR